VKDLAIAATALLALMITVATAPLASLQARPPADAAAPAAAPTSGQAPVRTSGYRIGPRDLIEIRVFETPELNVSRRVSEDGEVNLPLLGNVALGGLTEDEAAQKLKEILEKKLLQRASVTVQVQEFRSRPISVIGSVRQPGNLAFSGRWTLLEAVTAAGGLSDGHGSVIYVLRRAENGLTDEVAIPVADLLLRTDPTVNIPIVAGDLVNVPGTVDLTVYCLGEIRQPGAISFKSSERMTLLTLIARAGGLTDRASSKILIKRDGREGKKELKADYKRILAGKDPDLDLEAGDVVVVRESFF
jgi:polysaccharide biosynthesis/export protein